MTLDATVGGTSADSYLDVATADGLAAADIGRAATAWAAASTDSKERSLKRATREIDAYLRSSGIARYSASQSLLYPRAVDVANGTPRMAVEVQRLFRESTLSGTGILAMGGHEDGVLAFGGSAGEAGETLVRHLARALAAR